MNLTIEEQIRTTPKFSGSVNEDVVHWLQILEDLFDRFDIQPSDRYLIISFYFVADASIWFRHNQENARDWFTFKIELVKFFHPFPYSFLLEMEQSHQIFHSSTSPTNSSTSISNEEPETGNDSVDSICADPLHSTKVVENTDLYGHETRSSLASVTVIDLVLESYPWNTNKVDDSDELPQQRELVNTSDPLLSGFSDPFGDFTGSVTPFALFDKSSATCSRISIPDYTNYHRFHCKANRHAVNSPLPIIRGAYHLHTFNVHYIDKQQTQYHDILFLLVNEADGYSHHQIFR